MDTLLDIHDRSCQSSMNIYDLYFFIIFINICYISYVPHMNKVFTKSIDNPQTRSYTKVTKVLSLGSGGREVKPHRPGLHF